MTERPLGGIALFAIAPTTAFILAVYAVRAQVLVPTW